MRGQRSTVKIIVFILMACACAACTKTEDYLRSQVTAHSDLIDPSSAMFRNVTYRAFVWDIWCGEINTKNRMGGYVGWIPFRVKVYHDDGTVYVSVFQPIEAPYGATPKMREVIDDMNKSIADMHTFDCKEANPAPTWVPFWK